jgi:hypothetical protein
MVHLLLNNSEYGGPQPRRPSGWRGLDYSPFLRLEWLLVPDEKERAALLIAASPIAARANPTQPETETDRLHSSAGGAGVAGDPRSPRRANKLTTALDKLRWLQELTSAQMHSRFFGS